MAVLVAFGSWVKDNESLTFGIQNVNNGIDHEFIKYH